MSGAISKGKAGAIILGRVMLVFLGWCLVMTIYFTTYNQLERNAVPVSISPFRDFSAQQWDDGYFNAKGSFENQSAENDGDELLLQTNDITCVKTSNTCVIATADEFDGFMNLDVTTYGIDLWDSKQITFSSTSSICANWTYAVDRITQTVNAARRKKPVIPDYALKSPLHPCDHTEDLNVSLVKGTQVHEQKIKSFEVKNNLALHLYLVALNLAYFALVAWLIWRRRQRSRGEAVSSA